MAIDDELQPGTIALEFDAAGQLTADSVTQLNIVGYAPDNAAAMDMTVDRFHPYDGLFHHWCATPSLNVAP